MSAVIKRLKVKDQAYDIQDARIGTIDESLSMNSVNSNVPGSKTVYDYVNQRISDVNQTVADLGKTLKLRGKVDSVPSGTTYTLTGTTTPVNAVLGDVVICGDAEYVYLDGGEWEELGDLTDLKAFAYANEGEVLCNEVSGPASYTPAGEVAIVDSDVSKTVTVSGSYAPEGNVTVEHSFSGEVTSAPTNASTSATVSTADYTPTGSVAITPTTTTASNVTNPGSLPSYTAPTLAETAITSTSKVVTKGLTEAYDETTHTLELQWDTETVNDYSNLKSYSLTEGSFNPGSLPTYGQVTVLESASATFTGDKETGLKVTDVKYDKTTGVTSQFAVKDDSITATFTGTSKDISASGSVSVKEVASASFSGTAASITVPTAQVTHTVTPKA